MKTFLPFLRTLLMMFIISATLTSCYSTRTTTVEVNDFPQFRKDYIGRTHNQIVTEWGAPQRQLSDGAGGTILIYENTTTRSISNALATAYNINYFTRTYTPGVSTYTTQSSSTDYLQFFVDGGGKCYQVKTNIPMTHKKTVGEYRKFSWWKTIGLIYGCILTASCTAAVLLSH